jgi:hypothetical protein
LQGVSLQADSRGVKEGKADGQLWPDIRAQAR